MNIVIIPMIAIALIMGKVQSEDFTIKSRKFWDAQPPKKEDPMQNPVPFVVIHHSYIPAACNTTKECIKAMQWMQKFHQVDRDWNDIGYQFAVGGDGNVYEGRGWSTMGAHAPRYNSRSIGICVIGDWQKEIPPKNQLDAVHQLIEFGVKEGKIAEDYVLIGHRQVRATECPGQSFFDEISTWPHFSTEPK